ncbi:ferrichrome ABC transporter, ATP-binding [Mycoplasma suis KI3806]|uniref:Ferrichrome ABC transporter, ATP-binding n=1 Tax=Mycoplasma suis (strain KI_3806) TaxID=708248 RepID=F0V3J4_MYCS3|nr:ABC transporter ATP-binding protein [Mycoplasma suis]CBZ40416.1 ferrichrome ABC transporter, ATP-binding [Mycoplasma suis KI3806]
MNFLENQSFKSLTFFDELKWLFIAISIFLIVFKFLLSTKIYNSIVNIDSFLKTCFFLESVFNPFGIIFTKYLLLACPIESWEEKPSSPDLVSKLNQYYSKTIFPTIIPSQKKLLVISNLSFSYRHFPKVIANLYKYLSRLEFMRLKWEKYLSNRENEKLIRELNLSLNSGKFIVVVGSNGSGKSTIAKIIVHLLSNYEGKVLWAGKELKDISIKSFARNVSYIPQQSIIYHDISLFEFISIGFSPWEGFTKKISKSKKEEKVLEILKEMKLEKEMSKSLHSLSGGNRQKAIIARSIVQGSKIIVLDEPLNFLDIKNKIVVLDYLKSLQNKYGVTIIMIHHDIAQVQPYLDELVVIDNGFLEKHIRVR